MLGVAFHSGGFGAEIFAKIPGGKFGIFRQQLPIQDGVQLQGEGIGLQSQDMAAGGLVLAEEVEVPAEEVDSFHIGRAIYCNDAARYILVLELFLMAGRFGQGGIGLFAGIAAADMHFSESACGLEHVEDVGVFLYIGSQLLFQHFDGGDVFQLFHRDGGVKLGYCAKGHAIFRGHHGDIAIGCGTVGHAAARRPADGFGIPHAIRDVAEIRRGDRRGGDPGPRRDRWGGSKKLPTARLGSGELIGQAVVGGKPVNK